jgi:hypothetical protein
VPWCDTCDRFLSPSTVVADGTCPACAAHAVEDDEGLGPIPWHLKLLLGALAIYLGWRAFQGIEWLAHL